MRRNGEHHGLDPVAVRRLPICNFCLEVAEYEANVIDGRRARLCRFHLQRLAASEAGIRRFILMETPLNSSSGVLA